MALVLADRVKETTTTTGLGTVTLLGASTGYQSFSAVGNGNTTFYCISGQGTTEWEVGIGTYTSAGTTLSRDTILASSASGAKVSFSAGTKDVFVTYPAGRSVNYNQVGTSVDLTTPLTATGLTNSGLTSGRVVYSTTGGAQTDSANLTFNGTTLTAAGLAGPLNGTVGATTPNTGAFTTLSATTSAQVSTGATGAILQSYTGGGGFALYSTSVTPGNQNYSFYTTGSTTDVNASSNSRLLVGGSVIANASSTGLAVTGTGSFTSSLGLCGGAVPASTYAAAAANQKYIAWYDTGTSGGTSAYIRGNGGVLELAGTSMSFANGASVSTFTSTGLAVTGALSATSILSLGTSGASDVQLRSGSLDANYSYFQSITANGVTAKGYRWYNGSTNSMSLDPSGSLLLNTTTDPTTGAFPRAPLSIKGMSASAFAGIQLEASADQSVLGLGYDGTNFVLSTSYRSTGAYRGFQISVTNGTPTATFTTDGNVLVGTTASLGRFVVNAPSAATWTSFNYASSSTGNLYGIRQLFDQQAPNNTSSYFFFADDSASSRFYVFGNGGVANFQANNLNLSDLSVKENFTVFAQDAALTESIWQFGKRMKNAWGRFKYYDQTHDDWNNGYGAQLVKAAAGDDFPELVEAHEWSKDDRGNPVIREMVYDSDLMHLFGYIVTVAQERIEALEAKVAALEAA